MDNINFGNIQKPRNWQREATVKALNWYINKNKKHFLINAAPGSGKTICGSMIAAALIHDKKIENVIVIAPRTKVVEQWTKDFKFVTNRTMMVITPQTSDIIGEGIDACSTWNSISNLLDAYQKICNDKNTLVICDENHHAAVDAAWGHGAQGAFKNAKYVLILTGTPIRSDNKKTAWLHYSDGGKLDHPVDGSYELTYGEAIIQNYCRPIYFEKYDGEFKVQTKGKFVATVSSKNGKVYEDDYDKLDLKELDSSMEFYKLARSIPINPKDNNSVEYQNSYHRRLLETGIEKLNEIENRVPNAGGLIIAPNIPVAKYMAVLLKDHLNEDPVLVHSREKGADDRITAFKESKKRWIVSVNMISEGVDIPRLRVLIYLPNPTTELYFRQAMGRVVRSMGSDDDSSSTVIMPRHEIFEKWARRIKNEMIDAGVAPVKHKNTKKCPSCHEECSLKSTECHECGHIFPTRKTNFKPCINSECQQLNEISSKECVSCGTSFKNEFIVSLKTVMLDGGIADGIDLTPEDLSKSMKQWHILERDLKEGSLSQGEIDILADFRKKHPPEILSKLISRLSKE